MAREIQSRAAEQFRLRDQKDSTQQARSIMLNPEHGGFPELNTTRTRKSVSEPVVDAANKPARTRAKPAANAPAMLPNVEIA